MRNLFFDIETVPDGSIDDPDVVAGVKAPANYKDPEKIAAYIESKREDEFRKRALNGLTGQIISIAWALDDEPIEVITQKEGNEGQILSSFLAAVEGARRVRWIGHNSIEFDLRFLKQRCWINGIKPKVLIPADARHGDWSYDVMKQWGGWRGYVSQEALYKALGGPDLGDDGTDGSMVYDLHQAGEWDRIAAYNIRDVEKLRYNYSRICE